MNKLEVEFPKPEAAQLGGKSQRLLTAKLALLAFELLQNAQAGYAFLLIATNPSLLTLV